MAQAKNNSSKNAQASKKTGTSKSVPAVKKSESQATHSEKTATVSKDTPSKTAKDMQSTPASSPQARKDSKNSPASEFQKDRGKRGLGLGGGLALLLAGGIGGVVAAPHVAPMTPEPIAKYLQAPSIVDISAFEEQTTALNTGLADVLGRVEELEQAKSNGSTDDAVLAEVQEQLQSFQTEIDEKLTSAAIVDGEIDLSGIQAEIESLRAQNEEMRAQIDTGMQEATAEVTAAEDRVQLAEARAALTDLKLGVESGGDVIGAIGALEATGLEVPEALAGATDGVMSVGKLQESFGGFAIEAIRASMRATSSEGQGFLSSLTSRVSASFAGRSTTPQEGFTPDAILSRAEGHLRNADILTALEEMEGLPSEALEVVQPWITDAQKRLDYDNALATLEASLGQE